MVTTYRSSFRLNVSTVHPLRFQSSGDNIVKTCYPRTGRLAYIYDKVEIFKCRGAVIY